MSFWEDRFVHRPHAGGVTPGGYTDPQAPPIFGEARKSDDDYEVDETRAPAFGFGAAASEEADDHAHEGGEGVEAYERAEDEPEISEEAGEDDAVDDADAPVHEHRRRGLFRRRQPVPVDQAEDHEDGEGEPVTEDVVAEHEDEPLADELVAAVELSEATDELEAEAVEVSEEPAQPKRRRGLFRRRRHDDVVAEADPAADEPDFEAAGSAAAYGVASNGWSVVSDPPEQAFAVSSNEHEVEDVATAEAQAEPEAWQQADEDWHYQPEPAEPADEPVEERRRGLFRRRKPEPVAAVEADEVEAAEPYADRDDAGSDQPQWGGHDDAEHELAADDVAEDDAGAEVEADEAPTGQPRRRLFGRRRREDAVADAEPVGVEDADSVEDDAFENVPFYVPDYSSGEQAAVSDAPEYETEPFEHAGAFAAAEDEPSSNEPVFDLDAEPEPEPGAGDEPAFDAVLAADEESSPDAAPSGQDAAPDVELEPEPVSAEAATFASSQDATVESYGEPGEPEPFEPAPVDEGAAADVPDPVTEWSLAQPDDPEPAVEHEWATEGADEHASDPDTPAWQPTDEVVDSSEDHFADDESALQPVPVPARKRNGGSSRRGKKVVGLKVGASQIAAAVVSASGDEQALVDVARRPLEPGVVVGGELRDPESLVQALRSFFKEHGLPGKNVRLGLSSSRVGVRTFDISGVEDETRFDNAVRFKAHEVLPVAANESVLDYRVVEERYTENGDVTRRVLLVVAPRDQVEPYIAACREAGLRLAGVDLEAFGLLRAFVPPFGARSRTEDSATVVVAIGHESSTLLVAGGGICEFTRVFDWGGGALQNAITDELDVPHMEAETILTHLSLSGPGRHLDSLDADARSRALEVVRTRLTPFARELVSSLQFYQTQPESLGIREILITGGTSHLEGLADALHQMIGVNVSVGDPLARVSVQTDIPQALDATIGSLAVPIGLAIEDEAARSVNLLPKEDRQTRKRPNLVAVGVPIAAAVPVLALAFMFVQANGAAGDRQAELDAVRAQISALPQPTRPSIDPALAGEQAARATAVAQILGGRLTWERVLGDVSRILPRGVSLTELSATTPQPTTPEIAATGDGATPAPAPAPAAPATPTGVTVTGYALEYQSIARTLARLQAVPSLTNAQLQTATPNKVGTKRVIQFTIVADLAVAGGVQ